MFKSICNINVDEIKLPKEPWYCFKKPLKIRIIEKIISIFKNKDIENIVNLIFDKKQVWDSSNESEAITIIKKFGIKKDVDFIHFAFEHHTTYADYLFLVKTNGKSITLELLGNIAHERIKSLDLTLFNLANDEYNLYVQSLVNAFSNIGELSTFTSSPLIIIDIDNISSLKNIYKFSSMFKDNYPAKKYTFDEYSQLFSQYHLFEYKRVSLYETWLQLKLLTKNNDWKNYQVITVDNDLLNQKELKELCNGIINFNKEEVCLFSESE